MPRRNRKSKAQKRNHQTTKTLTGRQKNDNTQKKQHAPTVQPTVRTLRLTSPVTTLLSLLMRWMLSFFWSEMTAPPKTSLLQAEMDGTYLQERQSELFTKWTTSIGVESCGGRVWKGLWRSVGFGSMGWLANVSCVQRNALANSKVWLTSIGEDVASIVSSNSNLILWSSEVYWKRYSSMLHDKVSCIYMYAW